jgi:diaminohydroxyphosphoribosylaminopyrimidine deaminase/5-amino-6-(5-phosphoribosylamino)uracil reductase
VIGGHGGETVWAGVHPDGTGFMTDRDWLAYAVGLSHRCPQAGTAYSVGAVIVRDGRVLADGHSRELDASTHAEEAALQKLGTAPAGLAGATLYSSLEPCSRRASRPLSCTGLILGAGIRRVVYALREPPLFVECVGAALLAEAGVEVIEVRELAGEVAAINAHLPIGPAAR